MCRICKKDDGMVVCETCYNDEDLQVALEWWKKKYDSRQT